MLPCIAFLEFLLRSKSAKSKVCVETRCRALITATAALCLVRRVGRREKPFRNSFTKTGNDGAGF